MGNNYKNAVSTWNYKAVTINIQHIVGRLINYGKNLLKKLKTKLKGNFFKNILILMTGTVSVQLMNFLLTPIITRLYSPQAFGAMGLFLSIMGIVVAVAALSYPTAIVIGKSELETKLLVSLCLKLMILIGTMSILISWLVSFIRSENTIVFTLFLSIAIFPAVMTSIYTQLMIRRKKFKNLATITFIAALVVAILKISLGSLFPSQESLLISATIGFLITSMSMHILLHSHKNPLRTPFFNRVEKNLLIKYRRFPTYRMPQALNAALFQVVPISLLTYFFGIAEAGFYSLTRSVMMVPVSVIGKAVFDVSYPKISQDYSVRPLFKFLISSTLLLIAVSTIPLFVLTMWGEELFILIFGQEWAKSGTYASCMSVWFLFSVANRTCLAAIPVMELDKFLLKNSTINIIGSSCFFALTYYLFKNDKFAIFAFYSCATFFQLALIYKVISTAKKTDLLI